MPINISVETGLELVKFNLPNFSYFKDEIDNFCIFECNKEKESAKKY